MFRIGQNFQYLAKPLIQMNCTAGRLCSSQLGDLGSGAGRGGGGGGSIREAGGSFGKMEAAREEEYFYKKQLEQLEQLKNDQIHQAEYHHQQIKEHEEAIKRHKTFLKNMKN